MPTLAHPFIVQVAEEKVQSQLSGYHRVMTVRSDLLISADELSTLLGAEADLPPDAPRTRLLDVRWSLAEPDGLPAYQAGHIPGAVYVDLDTELSTHGQPSDGRHPLPDLETLTAAARRWGLNADDRVIAYDGNGNLSAARAWWVLRNAGITEVRLLDGALPAWVVAGLPLSTGDETPQPGDIVLGTGRLPSITLEEAEGFAREAILLDARAAERYSGASEPVDPRAGHIPGAHNLPTAGNLDADGRFLSTEALRERFASAGVTSNSRVGAYCGSGVTASHTLFALALTGVDGALFPGSWSQWANHPELPVATGPTP